MQHANLLRVGLTTLENAGRTSPSPYAVGILTGVRTILEIVLDSKESDRTFQPVAQRVLEISTACVTALPKEEVSYDFKTMYNAGQFTSVLDRIGKKLMVQTKRGRLARVALKTADATSLKELGEKLEQSASVLTLQLQMSNLRLTNRLSDVESSAYLLESEIDKAVARSQKEQLDLIKSHFTIQSKQNISKSHLPPAPHIFHGRSEATEDITMILLRPSASYICILGPGGIGKTALGLSVLHHPDVVTHYQSYRYFVSCDALTNAASLRSALANLFQIVEKEFWSQFPDMCRVLGSPLLVMMDNFETPWEEASTRKDVETFLSKLADVPNLSLILTLRGSERPYGVPWSRPFVSPLSTLDLTCAKSTFVEISDISSSSPGLEELLTAVDFLPLAITLLANQAQYTPILELLKQWNVQKTAMVSRGLEDRFSNLDVSIQISLASPRLSTGAISLLQILSVLPDGADEESLDEMAPDELDVKLTAATVVQVGLAYRNAGRLRSLSPVREHLQIYQPMSELLFRGVSAFHNNLAQYSHDAYRTDETYLMIEMITPQIGNIHSVLGLSLVKSELQKESISAIAAIHYFHDAINSGPHSSLLDAALQAAHSLQDPTLETDCLLAKTLFDPADRSRIYLDDLLKVCRSLNEPGRLGRCLYAYAVSHIYIDAKRTIDAATEIIDELESQIAIQTYAATFTVIITQHVFSGRLNDAWSLARRGLQIPGLTGRPRAKLLNTIGYLYSCAGRFTTALRYLTQSAETHGRFEDYYDYFAHQNMGQIYFMQSRLALAATSLDNAAKLIERTRLGHLSYYGPYLAARVAILNGDVPLALSKCQIINNIYIRGEVRYFHSRESATQRALLLLMAELEIFGHNLSAAFSHLQSIQVLNRKLQYSSRYNEVDSLFLRADLSAASGQLNEMINSSLLAAILCSRQGDPFGLSMALQRIGDTFYNCGEESSLPNATACYRAELGLIQDRRLDMGVNRHLGDCLLRLGMASLRSCNLDEAKSNLGNSRKYYEVAKDKDGINFCEARLDELENGERAEMLTVLPLGNRLFGI